MNPKSQISNLAWRAVLLSLLLCCAVGTFGQERPGGVSSNSVYNIALVAANSVGGPTNGVTAGTADSISKTNAAWAITNGSLGSVVKYLAPIKPVNADSNWFGPWTPGTTTAGLQEAWNSVAKGTNQGPYVTGIKLMVQEGYYFFTNALDFRTVRPFSTTIVGQNLLSTKLAYAGTGNGISTITFGSLLSAATNGGLNIPAHVTISDISLTAVQDMNTNVLLEIKDFSDLNLNRVNFTGWQVLTNQVDGAGVSIDSSSYAAVNGSGLVGVKIWRGPEHGTHLSSLYFMQLASGIDAQNDHVYAEDLRFGHIGVGTNPWPLTSRYRLGACIVREGGLESIWNKLHCYSSTAGFILLGQAYDSPLLVQANFEDCITPLGSLRANSRTPIALMPNVYGDLGWDSGPVKIYCVSNSPNYGVVTSLLHTNGVVVGTDRFLAASGSTAWEVRVGDTRVLQADSLGTKTVGRHDVESGTTTTTIDSNGIATTDGVNANQLNANGSSSFATGAAEFNAAGALKVTDSITLYDGTTAKFRIKFGGDSLQFDDLVNTIDGFITYDFLTGVLSYGEMNASKITSADGSAIDLVRPRMGTNSVSVTPNVSLYLTNFDGTVYRLSAQKL